MRNSAITQISHIALATGILSLAACSEKDTEAQNPGNESEKTETMELEEVDVVPSGNYSVIAHIVDPEEKEIYVKMEDDKVLELYLKGATKIMKGGEEVDFSALAKGQSLTIEVEKDGERMKPISVEILDTE